MPAIHRLSRMREPKQEGLIIVISGPSGSGKTTVCQKLIQKRCDTDFSVSVTTRPPRQGEQEGIDYFFVTLQEFWKKRDASQLVEWAEVFGQFYGTPAAPVEKALKEGQNVLLDIDVQGGFQVREKYPEAILVFVLPPSPNELVRRLQRRRTETFEEMGKRLIQANEELRRARQYDFLVLNNKVDEATKDLGSIIDAEKSRLGRQQNLLSDFVIAAGSIEKGKANIR